MHAKVYALGIHKTHPYKGVNQGPTSSRVHASTCCGNEHPSLPSVLLNARKTRTWALTSGATATSNDTQAFARTSRNSRYRSWYLALREPDCAALSQPCPTQTNYGDTAAVKSSYLSAQRHRDANTTWVSAVSRAAAAATPSNARHSMISEQLAVVLKSCYRLVQRHRDYTHSCGIAATNYLSMK